MGDLIVINDKVVENVDIGDVDLNTDETKDDEFVLTTIKSLKKFKKQCENRISEEIEKHNYQNSVLYYNNMVLLDCFTINKSEVQPIDFELSDFVKSTSDSNYYLDSNNTLISTYAIISSFNSGYKYRISNDNRMNNDKQITYKHIQLTNSFKFSYSDNTTTTQITFNKSNLNYPFYLTNYSYNYNLLHPSTHNLYHECLCENIINDMFYENEQAYLTIPVFCQIDEQTGEYQILYLKKFSDYLASHGVSITTSTSSESTDIYAWNYMYHLSDNMHYTANNIQRHPQYLSTDLTNADKPENVIVGCYYDNEGNEKIGVELSWNREHTYIGISTFDNMKILQFNYRNQYDPTYGFFYNINSRKQIKRTVNDEHAGDKDYYKRSKWCYEGACISALLGYYTDSAETIWSRGYIDRLNDIVLIKRKLSKSNLHIFIKPADYPETYNYYYKMYSDVFNSDLNVGSINDFYEVCYGLPYMKSIETCFSIYFTNNIYTDGSWQDIDFVNRHIDDEYSEIIDSDYYANIVFNSSRDLNNIYIAAFANEYENLKRKYRHSYQVFDFTKSRNIKTIHISNQIIKVDIFFKTMDVSKIEFTLTEPIQDVLIPINPDYSEPEPGQSATPDVEGYYYYKILINRA